MGYPFGVMRYLAALCSCFPLFAYSQTFEADVFFGGSNAGTHRVVQTADSLKSDAQISVAGQKISSNLHIKYKKGAPAEVEFEETQGPASGSYVWKNGKFSAILNGKKTAENKAYKFQTAAIFGTHHYTLAITIYKEWLAKNMPPKLKITDISSLATFESAVSVSSQTVPTETGTKAIDLMKLSIGGIELQYAIEGDNVVGFKVPAQMFEVVRKGYGGVFVDPLARYPELSQPNYKVKTVKVAQTPMRDGTILVSEIRRPDAEGKFPTILIRTPYGRNASASQYEFFAKRGYVVMSQDVRGRGGSGGGWDPFNTERNDGYDTLSWIEKQPWSDGGVGMIGGSYLGFVQWAAAVTHHPALKCIIPQVSPPDPLHNVPWDHGCFLLMGNVWWSRIVMNKDADMSAVSEGFGNTSVFKTMPITKVDNALFKSNIPFYDRWASRLSIENWPGAFRMDEIPGVKIPVMHVSGTWDGDGVGTMKHYRLQREGGGNQWLIFGPWEHGFNVKTKFGDQDYGPTAVLELDSTYLRFFDTYLKSKEVKMSDAPRTRFFVTGANKWYEGETWPPKGSESHKMYFGGGNASGKNGKGALENRAGAESSDSYTYDPTKVQIPKSVEINDEAVKLTQTRSEYSAIGLWYSGPKFSEPTVIAGPLQVNLYFKTTVFDAAVYAMALDEAPDGKATLVGLPGAMRIGFTSNGVNKLVPGKVYHVTVEPWLFAREFKPGHRLAIAIVSDLFPKYARIPGTGEPDATATKLLKATHTILKGGKHASSVTYYSFSNGLLKG